MLTPEQKNLRTRLLELINKGKAEALEAELKLPEYQDNPDILNAPDAEYPIPLHAASLLGDLTKMKLLINNGANYAALDHERKSAVDVAYLSFAEHTSPEILKARLKCIAFLLSEDLKNPILLKKINPGILNLLRIRKFQDQLAKFSEPDFRQHLQIVELFDKALDYVAENGGTTLADLYEELIYVGHTLGVIINLNIQSDKYKITLNSESNLGEFSLMYTDNVLRQYASLPTTDASTSQRFNNIRAAFEQTNPEIKIIPCTWPEHRLFIAIKGDQLVLCNRGVGTPKIRGVKIFKIKDRNLDIEKLLQATSGPKDFEEKLSKIVDLENPTRVFSEIKDQKYGTCSFVNAKALVAPLLYLEGDQNYYKTYKNFTNWIRNTVLDDLISKHSAAQMNRNPDEQFYFEILKKYLIKLDLTMHRQRKPGLRKTGGNLKRYAKLYKYFSSFEEGRNVTEFIDLRTVDSDNVLERLKTQVSETVHIEISNSKPTTKSRPSTPTPIPELFNPMKTALKRVVSSVMDLVTLDKPETEVALVQLPAPQELAEIKYDDQELAELIQVNFMLRLDEIEALQQQTRMQPPEKTAELNKIIRQEIILLNQDFQKFKRAIDPRQTEVLAEEYIGQRSQATQNLSRTLLLSEDLAVREQQNISDIYQHLHNKPKR